MRNYQKYIIKLHKHEEKKKRNIQKMKLSDTLSSDKFHLRKSTINSKFEILQKTK